MTLLSKSELSKSDFLEYLQCPKSLWLKKKKPELHRQSDLSEFDQKLIDDGYAIERIAGKLFEQAHYNIPQEEVAEHDGEHFFQTTFVFEKLLARTDILERVSNTGWNLIEIKSSTSLKKDHYIDLAFQKYVLEQCGFKVLDCYVLHCNKEYVKNGELEIDKLLKRERVSDKVLDIFLEVKKQILEFTDYASQEKIDESYCECLYKTKSNHCANFDYFNKNIPKNNIYQLNRISAKRINFLLDKGIISLSDADEKHFSSRAQLEVLSFKQDAPIINKAKIQKALGNLTFPLFFYDYETYNAAVPLLDGFWSQRHLVFQVSIHKMDDQGNLSHFEYLADKIEQPIELVRKMEEFTGTCGTFISWNKSFENTRNKEIASQFPSLKPYLDYVTTHTFDLMDIFKKDFVDYRSKGSTSIKNILPLLCPELSYGQLSIQDGAAALSMWMKSVRESTDEKEKIRRDLLDYCKLDTYAMVRIYQEIQSILND